MNKNTAALKDGQAPARRIGALIAIIIACIGCACPGGLWYLFAREGIDTWLKVFLWQPVGQRQRAPLPVWRNFMGAWGQGEFPQHQL